MAINISKTTNCCIVMKLIVKIWRGKKNNHDKISMQLFEDLCIILLILKIKGVKKQQKHCTCLLHRSEKLKWLYVIFAIIICAILYVFYASGMKICRNASRKYIWIDDHFVEFNSNGIHLWRNKKNDYNSKNFFWIIVNKWVDLLNYSYQCTLKSHKL